MSSTDVSVWLAVADDLQLRVTAPFSLLDGEGHRFEFDALFHDFGSREGMLLFAEWNAAAAVAASSKGFGYSCISADTYDRLSIIDVFRDWGWSGASSARPSWCMPLEEETEE